MKKSIFISALIGLILANIIAYSCQKENPKEIDKGLIFSLENVSVDRSSACTTITIGNGTDLIICGIDSGSDCSLCSGNYHSASIPDDMEEYPFANSSVYYICNPTPFDITYTVYFNCVGQPAQQFVAPALAWRVFHVDLVNNGSNWCCVSHAGCSH